MASAEEDRELILSQLYEMFTDIPPNRIGAICEQYNWQINACIDALVNASKTLTIQDKMTNDKYSGLQHGAIPKAISTHDRIRRPAVSSCSTNKMSGLEECLMEMKIHNRIKAGYRIMVIMRGAPGSGKSYTAANLIRNHPSLTANHNVREFIFSSDDYFLDSNANYGYNSKYLTEAHKFNQKRVHEKAEAGWSPIIVDNTNMKVWEMMPYVKYAVKFGYLIEVMEPNTPWRSRPDKLAFMNIHGVSRERIQKMLDKWEPTTPKALIDMLKNTRYTIKVPQMRLLPPIIKTPVETTTDEEFSTSIRGHGHAIAEDELSENHEMQPKRNSPTHVAGSEKKRDVYALLEQKIAAWNSKAEQASANCNSQQTNLDNQSVIKDDETMQCTSNKNVAPSIFDMLKDSINEQVLMSDDDAKNKAFQRHSVDCPNENSSFVHLRQIYPNKRISSLWDLFLKCDGNVDWVVDLLLMDDEYANNLITYRNEADEFKCDCKLYADNRHDEASNINTKMATAFAANNKPIPQGQSFRFKRGSHSQCTITQQLQQEIDNQSYTNNSFSNHISHNNNNDNNLIDNNNFTYAASTNSMASTASNVDAETQTDELYGWEYNNNNGDSNEQIKLNIGQTMIRQLVDSFHNEFPSLEHLKNTLPPNLNVFIPRNVAQVLHMLCMESMYNYIEEQRRKDIQNDEEFARLLKIPKYSNCQESPSDLQDLLDMELAWAIQKQQDDQPTETMDVDKRTDLATLLSQMKLCEKFPDIPRETLVDMLAANGNRYTDTLEMLSSSLAADGDNEQNRQSIAEEQQRLCVVARQENEIGESSAAEELFGSSGGQSSEKLKLLALQKFEESRNFAHHHTVLRNECCQKSKDALIRGNTATGTYYMEVAQFHKTKLDAYNHLAATCIIEVHKHTHKDSELLDLHYLYITEALVCLDIFLDCHIADLQDASRDSKELYIITGRGRHSANGVPTIKNRVKQRLRERCLRWAIENDGLLRVTVFYTTRYSSHMIIIR